MPRTEKLKIKTSLVNVAIIGTLVVITVAVGITLPTGEILSYAKTDSFIIAFFENPPKHPMRLLLNEAQCRKLWSAMMEFGYPHLTFAAVQAAALEVHKGNYNETDVIAVMTARQVDELQAEMDRRGM